MIPRKKPSILHRFVDIGGADMGRAAEMVFRKGGGKFVSVDPKPFTEPTISMMKEVFRERNVPFENYVRISEGGFEWMKKQPDHSVGILNMDLAGATEEELARLKAKPGSLLKFSPGFFRESHRVLLPNGRFYLTVAVPDFRKVSDMLAKEGFKVISENLDVLNSTKKMNSYSESIRFQGGLGKAANFVRIEARKVPVHFTQSSQRKAK